MISQDISKTQQRMQHRTRARTVRTNEQRDGSQRDVLAFADAFEVFDPEIGDHVGDSESGR